MSTLLVVTLGEAAATLVASTASIASADASTGTGGQFVATQGRVLDTRSAATGGYSTPMTAGQWRNVQIGGRGGVPASGVSAVAVTFTIVDQAGGGWLGADENLTAPSASIAYMNYNSTGQQSNSGVLALASNGQLMVRTSTATNLIIDVQGYYTADETVAPGGFVPIDAQRLVDTRNGTGLPQAKLTPGSTSTINVSSLSGGAVPAGASAAVLNFTTTNFATTSNGFFRAHAADKPAQSAFNFPGNTIDTTTAQVGLSAAGAMQFDLPAGLPASLDLVVDVVGYFRADNTPGTSSGAFTPGQARAYDSRAGGNAAIPARGTVTLKVGGVNGIPDAGADNVAIVANVAAISDGPNNGYLSVWSADDTNPAIPAVTYLAGKTVSNTYMSGIGVNGQVSVYNAGADPVNIILDVQGWYSETPTLPSEANLTPGENDPSAGDDVEPDQVPPSSTFGGTVQNVAGTAQPGLVVHISDPMSEPDAQPGADGWLAPTLGNTRTDADGKWSFTLPDPLPAQQQQEAAANGGVLNLDVDVTGYSTADGTPFNGQTTVPVAVMPPPDTNTAQGDGSASRTTTASTNSLSSSESVDADTVTAQNNSVTAMHVSGSVDADINAGDIDSPASDASARTSAPTTTKATSAMSTDTVDGTDHSNDQLTSEPVPVPGPSPERSASGTTTNSASSTRYKVDCNDGNGNPRGYYEIGHKDGTAYTIVGEGHAYWDAKAAYKTENSLTYTASVAVSLNLVDWGTSGEVEKTTDTGSGAQMPYTRSNFGKLLREPFKYRRHKLRQSCDRLKLSDGAWKFDSYVNHYRYRLENKGYWLDSKHYPMVWDPKSDVRSHDGYHGINGSRWKIPLSPGQTYWKKNGKALKYGVSVSAFGALLSFQAKLSDSKSSTNYQMVQAGNRRDRNHYVFQNYCNFNDSCNKAVYYSW